MKLKCFSIHDAKAEAFLRPFFAETRGLALRSFTSVVNDPSHDMHKYAEDYTLFEVGEFDDQTGLFVPLKAPAAVATAITVKEAL